jgi:AraC-like DNA-binding protein
MPPGPVLPYRMLDAEKNVNPVRKALWFIESHFAGEVTLAEISDVAGVSRFHMARTFGMTTGHSVMRYVRGRRLSEAARALARCAGYSDGRTRRRIRLA